MNAPRVRKSTLFLLTMMMESAVLALLLVHASLSEEAQRANLQEKAGVVTTFKLTDLCLFLKRATRDIRRRPIGMPRSRTILSRWNIFQRVRSLRRRRIQSGMTMKAWIEKQRYLIDFTLSSLLRRKVKNVSLLTLYS